MSTKSAKVIQPEPIRRWDGPEKCPNCRGNLREVGKDEWTLLELAKGLYSIFNLPGYLLQSVKSWGIIIVSSTQAESVLRQCEKCGNYVTKCPKCKKKFIPGGRPAMNFSIRTKCPFCETKITAWNSCDPPPSDTSDNDDDDRYSSWGGW